MPFVPERTPPLKESVIPDLQFAPEPLEEEEVCIEYPSAKLGAITRKRNQINELLLDRSEKCILLVQELYKEYLDKVSSFIEACDQQKGKPGVSSDDVASLIDWREQHLEEEKKFQQKIYSWLNPRRAEKERLQSHLDLDMQSVASKRTMQSNWSTTSSIRARLLEKKAKIAASEQLLEDKEKLRRAEFALEEEEMLQKRKRFELEEQKRKLNLLEERVEVNQLERELFKFENMDISHNVSKSVIDEAFPNMVDVGDVLKPKLDVASQKPEHESLVENICHSRPELSQVLMRQNEIAATLAQNQLRVMLPTRDLEPFDGKDATHYLFFILSFDATIDKRCPDDTDKYYLLLKYTKGEAHELVKSCSGLDASESYRSARKLLQSQYGNEYNIANNYLEKLEKWPEIRSEDATALNELATFLTSCSNMMKNMSGLNQLNSLKEVRDIVKKLPFDMRKKFRSQAASHIEHGKEVSFQTLVDFINGEARVLKLPLLGDICLDLKRNQSRNVRLNKKSFATSTSSDNNKNVKQHENCQCCAKSNHELDACIFFNKKLLKEREEFIRKKNLCFGCLRAGHSTRSCRNRIMCKKCNRSHPTCLHRIENTQEKQGTKKANEETVKEEIIEYPKPSAPFVPSPEARSCAAAGVHSFSTRVRVVCAAVPVDIRARGQAKMIRTYMGMDQWASDGFIDEDLLRELNIEGRKTTLSLTTMGNKQSNIAVKLIENLEILSLDGKGISVIPKVYSKKDWPFELEDSPKKTDIAGYPQLEKLPFEFIKKKIGLLVGVNMTELVIPHRIVSTKRGGPYATLHKFGWALNGPVKTLASSEKISCHCIIGQENYELNIEEKLDELYSRDFVDNFEEGLAPSFNDLKWTELVEKSLQKLDNDHFEIDLPFVDEHVEMPYNYSQAFDRLQCLKNQFLKNEQYLKEYSEFVKKMRDNKFIEEIPQDELYGESGKVWYLVHFGVRHKQKGKLRIVFDCSLKFEGVSLNDKLLQGPDLTNSLIGVLIRFRQGRIAITGDIESMFYQIAVPRKSANFMRFLWFENDDLQKRPIQYRLVVHVFGAKSSPSIANYALRRVALDANDDVNKSVTETILNAFYVDDLIKSVEDEKTAVRLLKDIEALLHASGFNLTGFVSNSRTVLQSLPVAKLSKELKEIEIANENLPFERALGVIWNVEKDSLSFRVNIPEKPCTKRGILSTIFSIYDPYFIVSPAIIPAKRIYQEICSGKFDWDDPLPETVKQRWNQWRYQIVLLREYEVPRRFCLSQYAIENTQLHIFVDGSEIAYGAVAYLRCVDAMRNIFCSIVMAKVRLTPLNRASLKTVPRIELNAAKIGVELKQKVKKELEMRLDNEYLWSDSLTVLNYIKSDTGRFQRFVANRVAFIRNHSQVDQWKFVPTSLNVADLISRGSKSTRDFIACNKWKAGPEFLSKEMAEWPKPPKCNTVTEDDVELKKGCNLMTTRTDEDLLQKLLNSTSDWLKLRYRVAAMLRVREKLLHKPCKYGKIDVLELLQAEHAIWRLLQRSEFPEAYDLLQSGKSLPKRHPLTKLSPFIDEKGVMRVGGRLRNAPIPESAKHPILLPQRPHAIRIFVEDTHRRCGHLGREYVLSQLRQSVYIVAGVALVKNIIRRCITCKMLQGKASEQIMADLPTERVTGELPAFNTTGIDYFGPFMVSRGRSRAQEKRFGVIFTCLASRAVHIEIAHSLDASSFINALRRFLARRGSVQHIRSDNGTNFVAGNRELKESIQQWNENQIDEFCKNKGIKWSFNTPYASHHGGVWEREIRTIRKVLNGLMAELPTKTNVNDEMLTTLMCEVEFILNNRPLTALSSDPNDLEPLTANHLLLHYNGVSFPPGIFSRDDLYVRRCWRQVQYLADVFWQRWRKEYLPILIARQKWAVQRKSHEVGDLVLVTDQHLPRNLWCMGRIVDITPDSKGNVRIVRIKVSRYKSGEDLKTGIAYLDRPISKLILLRTADEL